MPTSPLILRTVMVLCGWPLHTVVGQSRACTDTAGFVRTHGSDTIAVEQVRETKDGVSGDIYFVAEHMRARYSVAVDRSRDETSFALALWEPGADTNAAPAQTGTLLLRADSAVFIAGRAGETQRTRTSAPPGTMPGFQLATGLEELLVRKARSLGNNTVEIPVHFVGTGGWTPVARVEFLSSDSATMQLGEARMRLRTDLHGRILGASISTAGDQGGPVRLARVGCAESRVLMRRP